MGYLNYLKHVTQLIGFQVQSLTVTPNSIGINFSQGTGGDRRSANVDIEAGFDLSKDAKHIVAWQGSSQANFRESAGCLTKLIECIVIDAKNSETGEVDIYFNDGSKLRLLVDPRGFDSYTLSAITQS